MIHLVASTGRTATSLIAQALDGLGGLAACHEGHRGNDQGTDLLPMVNLDNLAAFKSAEKAAQIVAAKRSADVVTEACARASGSGRRVDTVLDVAYYNAVIGEAVLALHPTSRMVGIVRDCAGFVRSVTWLEGEDPMPVGWPDPGKPLSARERFISMGRVRPSTGPDVDEWSTWGPIERNIWLWKATNHRLLDARDTFPDRVTMLDFAALPADPGAFLEQIVEALHLDVSPPEGRSWGDLADAASDRGNSRVGGYQIGRPDSWTTAQRTLLEAAEAEINERFPHVRH